MAAMVAVGSYAESITHGGTTINMDFVDIGYTTYATGDTIPTIETDSNYGGSSGFYSAPWSVGTGSVENNGTYDMSGNVWEWNESAWDGTLDDMNELRVIWGGHYGDSSRDSISYYGRNNGNTTDEFGYLGFRVAAIPEPSSAILIAVVGGLGLFVRRHFPSV